MEPNTLWKCVNPEPKPEPKAETKTYQDGVRRPNPVRSDGFVQQRYVPCASADTPEEILEHYMQMWAKTQTRWARTVGSERVKLHEESEHWKEMYDVAKIMAQSYRVAMGQGTLIKVEGRHGRHKDHEHEIPLTTPGGVIHLWTDKNSYNILCGDDACVGESAVKSLEYVTCEKCREFAT